MRYLLDTCVISELAKRPSNRNVVRWIEGCDEEAVCVSALTIGEIQKGIGKLAEGARRFSLQHWLDGELKERFAGRILAVTEEVAQAWGLIQAEAEIRGAPIPTIDGLIGATAVAHNLTVVTRNERDMIRTGARVVNPWTA